MDLSFFKKRITVAAVALQKINATIPSHSGAQRPLQIFSTEDQCHYAVLPLNHPSPTSQQANKKHLRPLLVLSSKNPGDFNQEGRRKILAGYKSREELTVFMKKGVEFMTLLAITNIITGKKADLLGFSIAGTSSSCSCVSICSVAFILLFIPE